MLCLQSNKKRTSISFPLIRFINRYAYDKTPSPEGEGCYKVNYFYPHTTNIYLIDLLLALRRRLRSRDRVNVCAAFGGGNGFGCPDGFAGNVLGHSAHE